MPRRAPPSRHQQFAARCGVHVLEVGDPGVFGIASEAVLLVVGGSEYVIAQALNGEDPEDALDPEVDRVDGQVAGLQGVDEGKPDQIAKGQHEAKSIASDVYRA